MVGQKTEREIKMSNDNVIDLCNDDDDDNTTEFEVRMTNTHFFVSTNNT